MSAILTADVNQKCGETKKMGWGGFNVLPGVINVDSQLQEIGYSKEQISLNDSWFRRSGDKIGTTN